MLPRVNRFQKEPRMSSRTTRRRLRIATALIAATLAGPGVASAASDLRGEYAKDPGTASQTSRGTDLRGEFAQVPSQLAVAAQGTDARGEFAKPEYRGDPVTVQAPPADSAEPSDAPSALPFIVAGLVALLGFAAVAIAVPLRRRVRVSH
jgi:hypothetical protein